MIIYVTLLDNALNLSFYSIRKPAISIQDNETKIRNRNIMVQLKNILRQEKFNKLNKILFFGLAIFFVIAAIINKNLFLAFVAFCFLVVGISPQGTSTPTKTERMQQVADEVEKVYNNDDNDEEPTEEDSEEEPTDDEDSE